MKFQIIRRLWVVCTPAQQALSSFGQQNLQMWENLCMAQAHKAGRDFHYAKFLMTEELDEWNYELTHR